MSRAICLGLVHWNTLKLAFTRFARDDCFQAYVIDDYVTPRVPSNHAARKEFERRSHRMIAID
jgi:hypothetical protein